MSWYLSNHVVFFPKATLFMPDDWGHVTQLHARDKPLVRRWCECLAAGSIVDGQLRREPRRSSNGLGVNVGPWLQKTPSKAGHHIISIF